MLEKQASQQSAKKRKRYIYIYILTSLTPTSAFTQFIVTTRELVKIEGGAKVGTAHSQGKVANDLN